jgi:hypothetical protein
VYSAEIKVATSMKNVVMPLSGDALSLILGQLVLVGRSKVEAWTLACRAERCEHAKLGMLIGSQIS